MLEHKHLEDGTHREKNLIAFVGIEEGNCKYEIAK